MPSSCTRKYCWIFISERRLFIGPKKLHHYHFVSGCARLPWGLKKGRIEGPLTVTIFSGTWNTDIGFGQLLGTIALSEMCQRICKSCWRQRVRTQRFVSLYSAFVARDKKAFPLVSWRRHELVRKGNCFEKKASFLTILSGSAFVCMLTFIFYEWWLIES